MSLQETELRRDQLTLYPMQQELDTKTQMQLKGGLTLWLMGMSVPILLLFELRYVMVGGYVDPKANTVLGVLGLLGLLVGAVLLTTAQRSTANGNRKAIVTLYGVAFWFELAALILIGWQVFDRSLSTLSHYGMTFMAVAGTVDFYVFGGIIAILAARSRVKRLNAAIQDYWSTKSTMIYSWFLVVVWLVMFILLYFL
jgi:heme/copper-type cytochrome/quinol oxidase subunit 3